MKKIKHRFGQNLKYERERIGFTQKELAENLSISPSYISNMENNNHLPSILLFIRIMNFFHLTADYLLYFDHNNPTSLQNFSLMIHMLTKEEQDIVKKYIKRLISEKSK